jgi:glycosyltransferase involved in cell wall biosynthesis
MSASALASHIPLVVSIWGNDLTLNAAHSPVQRHWTRMTLHRANALMADSWRDLRLAPRHGFSKARPMLRVPGNGGIKADVFFHGPADPDLRARLEIPLSAKVVLNPRGVREYVRTEAFFFAIRELRTAREDIWFVATGLKANARYEALAARLGISDRLRMLGTVPRGDMAKLYRLADVMVSPSVHDGTPNCLLEAMACGSFPIVGDIETMHEWIQHERNGLLVDPADPREIASAIVTAVDAEDFRMKAASFNVALVSRDANFGTCMSQVTSFYEELVSAQSGPARQGDRAIGPGPQEPT